MSERCSILFLHGFTNTGASWSPVIEALGERYSAVAPDLRGHGSASAAHPVTLDAVLDDIEQLAPPAPFILCGYSQGGRIALHAALRIPDRIGRLVLIGASPGISDPDERAARVRDDERLARELESSTIEAFAERWAQTPVLAGVSDEVAARAQADRLRNQPAALASALRGLGTGALPPLWNELAQLPMPVTLVAGERDAKFIAVAEAMAATIPRPEVRIVSGAGHAAHLERPEAIASILSIEVE